MKKTITAIAIAATTMLANANTLENTLAVEGKKANTIAQTINTYENVKDTITVGYVKDYNNMHLNVVKVGYKINKNNNDLGIETELYAFANVGTGDRVKDLTYTNTNIRETIDRLGAGFTIAKVFSINANNSLKVGLTTGIKKDTKVSETTQYAGIYNSYKGYMLPILGYSYKKIDVNFIPLDKNFILNISYNF